MKNGMIIVDDRSSRPVAVWIDDVIKIKEHTRNLCYLHLKSLDGRSMVIRETVNGVVGKIYAESCIWPQHSTACGFEKSRVEEYTP